MVRYPRELESTFWISQVLRGQRSNGLSCVSSVTVSSARLRTMYPHCRPALARFDGGETAIKGCPSTLAHAYLPNSHLATCCMQQRGCPRFRSTLCPVDISAESKKHVFSYHSPTRPSIVLRLFCLRSSSLEISAQAFFCITNNNNPSEHLHHLKSLVTG